VKEVSSPAQSDSQDLEGERKRLIQEIAALDDRFAAKEIGEEEYKDLRSRKKERLVEITQQLKTSNQKPSN
jgi:hypothetical protein